MVKETRYLPRPPEATSPLVTLLTRAGGAGGEARGQEQKEEGMGSSQFLGRETRFHPLCRELDQKSTVSHAKWANP